ncbi:MAG: hypothetical protein AABY18_09745 [Candidatus Thermoplasmatota archaeon]
MEKRSVAYALFGVAFLLYVWGYLAFDLTFFALTTVVAGFACLAAIRWPRIGLWVVAAMCMAWAIGFYPAGISLISTIMAGVLAAGFVLLTLGISWSRPILELVGVSLAIVAHLWYVTDNAILSWTPGFAIGNMLFVIGGGLLAWSIWSSMNAAAPVVTPSAPAKRPAANRARKQT